MSHEQSTTHLRRKLLIPMSIATKFLIAINGMLLVGCHHPTKENRDRIDSFGPSDSVVIVYEGLNDTEKMLTLKILCNSRFNGTAHAESFRKPKTKGCKEPIMHPCFQDPWINRRSGIVGVIYMSDDDIFRNFSKMRTWANDCGHFTVRAWWEKNSTHRYMYLQHLDSLVKSSSIDERSKVIYNRFIYDINSQEEIRPIGCM